MNFIKKNYLVFVAFVAFVCYQVINFYYFSTTSVIFGDERRFIAEAIKLSETGEFWKSTFRAWEMPMTAIIYSLFYGIFETKESLIIFVRVFQSSLLILQAYILYCISLKLFKDQIAAYLTYTIVLFYPFFIFYQGLLLSENIFITLLIVSFYYIYTWYEDNFKINSHFILANFFLIMTIYSKGTLSILPPLLLTSFYFINRYNWRNTLKVFFLSTLLYLSFMSPWWIRNYILFDQFIPFTTSSGMNLYLGNNKYNLSGGADWSKDVNIREVSRMFSIEDELLQNNAFKEKALNFISNNPDRFVELAWLKLKRFYNIIPNADVYKQGYYKWVSLISYGSIIILFILSLIIHLKYFKKLSAIYILFIYYTLIHVIVIASLRYRLPLEAFMILLGTPVLSKFITMVKTK